MKALAGRLVRSQRFMTVYLVILYSAQTTGFAHRLHGWELGVSIGFLTLGFAIHNYYVVIGIARMFQTTLPLQQLYQEYAWHFVTALINIVLFANLHYIFGVNEGGEIISGNWLSSLYLSIATWTSLGFADIMPIAKLRLVVSLEALMGYLYMGVLVGLLLNIAQHTMKPSVPSISA